MHTFPPFFSLTACFLFSYEPSSEKTSLLGFGPGLHKTWLNIHMRWLEAGNFGFRKNRDFTIYVAKTKALISCAVTVQLFCPFVFAYVKCRFSHDAAHIVLTSMHSSYQTCIHVLIRFCKIKSGPFHHLSVYKQSDALSNC